MIDWQSSDSHYLINNSELVEKIKGYEPDYPRHIWLQTSGTSEGQPKLIALSKSSILTSAKSVNQHIKATNKDIWLCSLPTDHIGGLAIFARAHLSGSTVVEVSSKWEPQSFVNQVEKHKATLCSLVPTQLYDLVSHAITSPKSLRVVFVGGGSLDKSLYLKARELGWPVLPTYGMTECSSQVATASLESLKQVGEYQLKPLAHVSLKLSEDKLLMIKSESLLTVAATFEGERLMKTKPLQGDWFTTNDEVELSDQSLKFVARKNNLYKVSGHLINLDELQLKWQNFLPGEGTVLVAVPQLRTECQIDLVSELTDFNKVTHCVSSYNKSVPADQKIRSIYFVEKLLKTDLGRVNRLKLIKALGF